MSKREKLQKDFENFNQIIEEAAKKEIEKIAQQVKSVKKEANEAGQTFGSSINEGQARANKKKVNT